jgi:hypothetical protein
MPESLNAQLLDLVSTEVGVGRARLAMTLTICCCSSCCSCLAFCE